MQIKTTSNTTLLKGLEARWYGRIIDKYHISAHAKYGACSADLCWHWAKLRHAKSHAKSPSRAKSVMQFFEKMCQKLWNHDLRLPSYSTRRELPESSNILEKGWICVELWSFYCSKRISVPMSYISSWDIRVPEPANPTSHAFFRKKRNRRL